MKSCLGPVHMAIAKAASSSELSLRNYEAHTGKALSLEPATRGSQYREKLSALLRTKQELIQPKLRSNETGQTMWNYKVQ